MRHELKIYCTQRKIQSNKARFWEPGEGLPLPRVGDVDNFTAKHPFRTQVEATLRQDQNVELRHHTGFVSYTIFKCNKKKCSITTQLLLINSNSSNKPQTGEAGSGNKVQDSEGESLQFTGNLNRTKSRCLVDDVVSVNIRETILVKFDVNLRLQ